MSSPAQIGKKLPGSRWPLRLQLQLLQLLQRCGCPVPVRLSLLAACDAVESGNVEGDATLNVLAQNESACPSRLTPLGSKPVRPAPCAPQPHSSCLVNTDPWARGPVGETNKAPKQIEASRKIKTHV